jgi:hypothetical protein
MKALEHIEMLRTTSPVTEHYIPEELKLQTHGLRSGEGMWTYDLSC